MIEHVMCQSGFSGSLVKAGDQVIDFSRLLVAGNLLMAYLNLPRSEKMLGNCNPYNVQTDGVKPSTC